MKNELFLKLEINELSFTAKSTANNLSIAWASSIFYGLQKK